MSGTFQLQLIFIKITGRPVLSQTNLTFIRITGRPVLSQTNLTFLKNYWTSGTFPNKPYIYKNYWTSGTFHTSFLVLDVPDVWNFFQNSTTFPYIYWMSCTSRYFSTVQKTLQNIHISPKLPDVQHFPTFLSMLIICRTRKKLHTPKHMCIQVPIKA